MSEKHLISPDRVDEIEVILSGALAGDAVSQVKLDKIGDREWASFMSCRKARRAAAEAAALAAKDAAKEAGDNQTPAVVLRGLGRISAALRQQ